MDMQPHASLMMVHLECCPVNASLHILAKLITEKSFALLALGVMQQICLTKWNQYAALGKNHSSHTGCEADGGIWES